MSWSDNTGWWIGVIILLVLILIVLAVICWVMYSAFCKVEKAVEKALCEFYVFENRIMHGVEKIGEKATPLIQKGVKGLEARLASGQGLPSLTPQTSLRASLGSQGLLST